MQPQDSSDDIDYQQPVAYDAEGRPLYAAPVSQSLAAANSGQPQHTVVHVARSVTPVQQEISPEIKARHDESVAKHPHLNLSPEEYVVSAVYRHPIGMVVPIALTVTMVLLVIGLMIGYPAIMAGMGMMTPPGFGLVLLMGISLILLFCIGGYVAVWVYQNNGFYLTNESVIQEIQHSVFSRKEQTVSLNNIEDASYTQRGVLQNLLDYGSIRLSTEGDETTYRFEYVAHPKKQIAILNNAVEAFKNGRPVTPED